MKTEKTLSVDARIFFAIANLRGIKDIRYYLNGVYVEPCEAGGVVVAATNGYALAATRDPDGSVSAPMIVPVSDALEKAFLKQKRVHGYVVRTDGGLIQLANEFKVALHIQPEDAEVDGKYPNWRKVVPKVDDRTEMAAAWFNPKYLVPLCKAVSALDGGDSFMRLYGAGKEESALVRMARQPDFIGVVMPVRHDEALAIPKWAVAPELPRPEVPAAQETTAECAEGKP